MFKKIMKYTGLMILIFTVLSSLFGITILKHDLDLIMEIHFSDIQKINNRYNQTINNDLELMKLLQETMRIFKNEDTLLYKKIEKLDTQITKKVNIDEILNSDVFVRGFTGEGAGTIIKKTEENIYILTCYHIVSEIIEVKEKIGFDFGVTIGYSKNDKKDSIVGMVIYGTEIIKYDIENDLALLKTFVDDDNLIAVNLAEYEPIKGDIVYSIGTPLGLSRTISKGILCNKLDGFYFSDNTITFGNSGGGLYNNKGELIGVPSNVMSYENGLNKDEEEILVPETGLGMSISLQRIKEFLKGVEY